MERKEIAAEVANCAIFVCVVLLVFWGFGQVADPFKVSVISHIHWGWALAALVVAFIAAIGEKLCLPKPTKKKRPVKQPAFKARFYL